MQYVTRWELLICFWTCYFVFCFLCLCPFSDGILSIDFSSDFIDPRTTSLPLSSYRHGTEAFHGRHRSTREEFNQTEAPRSNVRPEELPR